MPSRMLVDATDLNSWANRRDAQGRLPQFIRRLILATVDDISLIEFRAGEGVQLGSWDGIVAVEVDNAFVPKGPSVWEMGTNRDPKGKAEDDYQKRSDSPGSIDPGTTTFVFVTPRRWSSKREWAGARKGRVVGNTFVPTMPTTWRPGSNFRSRSTPGSRNNLGKGYTPV